MTTTIKLCTGQSRHGRKVVPCGRAAVERGLCARHLLGARKTKVAIARQRERKRQVKGT